MSQLNPPTAEYVELRLAAIQVAGSNRDGDLVVSILRGIMADGHLELADRILNDLIQQGLGHLVGGTR